MTNNTTEGSILIVGASQGLGHAMAAEFAKRGWRVLGTVRGERPTPLHRLAEDSGGAIDVEHVDITRDDEIASLRRRLTGSRFDILFLNAGTAGDSMNETVAEVAADEFARVMLTNAFGVMRAVEALADLVRPAGLIGVMSSGQGSINNNTNGLNDVYRASKAALNQLMRSFAARRRDSGQALILMAPGWIKTRLGGPDAPSTMDEAVPKVVETLLANRGADGLRFLDRDGRELPW